MRRFVIAAGATVGIALGTTGCGEAAEGGEGESFEYGASMEETRAAFADVEPVTVTFQSGGASGNTPLGETAQQFADEVSEWSDGVVTIDLHWDGSIVPSTEIDDALADGRLDLGQLGTSYQPQEFPVTNVMTDASVLGSVTPLSGALAQTVTTLQTTSETSAIYEEFADKNMTPLITVASVGSIGVACSEPVETVEDLQGRQIVSSSTAQSDQIQALGASPSSLDHTEVYEALQRGTVDCSTAAPNLYSGFGLDSVAPYYYFPEGTNFQNLTTSIIAGSSWDSLPLPARQLIYDKLYEWLQASNHAMFRALGETNDALTDTDGEVAYFDSSVSTALQAANETIVAEQTTTDLFDAADYFERYEEAFEQWKEEAETLGYTDDGNHADFGDWYQGDLDSASGEYLNEYYDSVFDEVARDRRPE